MIRNYLDQSLQFSKSSRPNYSIMESFKSKKPTKNQSEATLITIQITHNQIVNDNL